MTAAGGKKFFTVELDLAARGCAYRTQWSVGRCRWRFQPAIFQPWWFVQKELLPENAVEDAVSKDFIAVRELAAFTADWLTVQVTLEKAMFSTVEEGRELDLRDIAKAILDLLPETPVDAVGLNADAHFRVASEEAWHEIGDLFLPKDFWEPIFEGEEWKRRESGLVVGLRSLTVEASRSDIPAVVRTEVAPSVRVTPFGVYVGMNAHFQLTEEDNRSNGYDAARTLDEHWEATRALEKTLIERMLEIGG